MNFVAWIQAHVVGMAVLGMALLDFVIELVPSIKANSAVSVILSILQKIAGGAAQPPAA